MGGLTLKARIANPKEVIARLNGLKNAGREEFKTALEEIFEESIKVLKTYPPPTEGNSPPPPYYERKKGMYSYGGYLRPNRLSGDLTNQWKYEVKSNDRGVGGNLVNDAFNPGHVPYAGYVHGTADHEPPQTLFHKDHGWPVAIEVVREKTRADAPIMQRVLRAIANKFNRG